MKLGKSIRYLSSAGAEASGRGRWNQVGVRRSWPSRRDQPTRHWLPGFVAQCFSLQHEELEAGRIDHLTEVVRGVGIAAVRSQLVSLRRVVDQRLDGENQPAPRA